MDPALQHHADANSDFERHDSDSSNLSSPVSRPESLFAAHIKSQISPHKGRARAPTAQSYHSASSELSSEVAPEIVVWTEDMDVDLDSGDELSSLSDAPMSK